MLEGKNNWKAWLYLAPGLILLGIFSFYPIIKSFIIAFIRDYNPVKDVFNETVAANKEAGLSYFTFDNFGVVLKNYYFKKAILNTLLIAFVSVPCSLIISLIISVLLVSIEKLRGFFQTLFFLPYVTSAMAVAMAFTVLFANNGSKTTVITNGPINSAIASLGLENPMTDFFDWLYWKDQGESYWNEKLLLKKDGTRDEDKLDEQYEAYVLTELAQYITDDEAIADYAAYVAGGTYGVDYFTKWEDYLLYKNKEEFYSSIKNDTAVYNTFRHKYKTLGFIDWVGGEASWATSIIVVLIYSIWGGLAFKILVFTGGLTGIDKQYYDAAKIDNTSKWRTFWKITVPMMSPLIVYILITSMIGSFKTYTSIIGLYGESMGPASAPGTLQTFVGIVYDYIGSGNSGIRNGAAAAVLLFAIIFVITKATNALTKRRTHY